jgi:predicted signal transduction protein with EAL and GGDEF domain
VIRTINVLAHELGMECVADSIDDAGTLALVRTLGADYGQGSALSPPLPLADFEALCAAGWIEHPPEIRRALGGSPALNVRPRATLPVPVV